MWCARVGFGSSGHQEPQCDRGGKRHMLSRDNQSGFKLQWDQVRGKVKLNRIRRTALQDDTCRTKRLWAVCVAALIATTPAYGASGQAGFVCTETVATITNGSATPVHQTWANAMMVFDFDRKLVFHGDGSESYPIHKVRDDVITWKSEGGDLRGFFNRRTLEAGEFDSRSGTLTHRAYACRLNTYLSFDLKP